MVVSPAEAKRRMQELQAFVAEVMVKDLDFGTIPGTDKPTLLQPGAQKLAEMYGFAQRFEEVASIEDWDKPLFMFRRRCVLTSRTDERFIGDGIGSCNSREDRYAWRWVWNKPANFPNAKTKQTRNGKTQWRIPNEDIFSLVNTIEKMACKRALIMAVIGATRSAGLFTQDAEDLPPDAYGEAESERSWDRTEEKPAGPDFVAIAKAFADRMDAVSVGGTLKELDALGAEIRNAIPREHPARLELAAKYAAAQAMFKKEADKARKSEPGVEDFPS